MKTLKNQQSEIVRLSGFALLLFCNVKFKKFVLTSVKAVAIITERY